MGDSRVRYACLAERLIANSVIAEHGDCWLWTGRTRRGYGAINIRDEDGTHRTRQAHRVAYELWIGPIPSGHTVEHTCRQTLCINPGHFEALTNQENAARSQRDNPRAPWYSRRAISGDDNGESETGRACDQP